MMLLETAVEVSQRACVVNSGAVDSMGRLSGHVRANQTVGCLHSCDVDKRGATSPSEEEAYNTAQRTCIQVGSEESAGSGLACRGVVLTLLYPCSARRDSRNGRRRQRIQPSFRKLVEKNRNSRPSTSDTAASSGTEAGTSSSGDLLWLHHDDDVETVSSIDDEDGDSVHDLFDIRCTSTPSPRSSPAVRAGLEAPFRRVSTSNRLNSLLQRQDTKRGGMTSTLPAWLHLSKRKFVPSWRKLPTTPIRSPYHARRRRSSLPDAIPSTLGVGTLAVAVTGARRAARRARHAVKSRNRADELVRSVTRRAVSPAVRHAAGAGGWVAGSDRLRGGVTSAAASKSGRSPEGVEVATATATATSTMPDAPMRAEGSRRDVYVHPSVVTLRHRLHR